jgi:GDPmannose 4,6-dehydratase
VSKILIFGVTGQDGSYLAEILLKQGHEVHGMVRKSATGNTINIDHLIDSELHDSAQFKLHRGDLLDHASIFKCINEVRPNYIYNEADQDHVSWSYDIPSYSISITTTAVVNIMEAIRVIDPTIKFFQPVSSNMFGVPESEYQNEDAAHKPVSPYGIAKSATFNLCKFYRDSYGLRISTGIFYNHESPRRPDEYLSRKVTKAAARIKLGLQDKLVLGDLNSYVDWGYAREFMEIAKLINEADLAEDFVVGTGELTKVEDFVIKAFEKVGLDWKDYVETSDAFKRPVPTGSLRADNSKLKRMVGIKPKVLIDQLIELMVAHDLEAEGRQLTT